MAFKSDAQRKYVFGVLFGGKTSVSGYHVSTKPLSAKALRMDTPLHIGTREAALKRMSDLQTHWLPGPRPTNFYLYKVRVPTHKDRVLLTTSFGRRTNYGDGSFTVPEYAGPSTFLPREVGGRSKRLFDEGLGTDLHRLDPYLNLDSMSGGAHYIPSGRRARTLQRLQKKFDILPYINRHEDAGHVSIAVLNPRRAKLRLVRLRHKKLKF